MFRKTLITTVTTVALATGIAGAQYQNTPGPQQPAPQSDPAAALVQQARQGQGQYFSFAQGPGFKLMDESTNMVIVGSNELGAIYGLCGWIGMFDCPSADAYAQKFVSICQFQNVRVTSAQSVQPTQGFAQAKYYEFDYSAGGQSFKGAVLVNFAPTGNTSNGAIHFIACRPERFDQLKPALSRLAMSVTASNANTFGAVAQFQATRPRGDYGIGDWKPYDSSKTDDRLSRHRSEAMLGYETVHDSTTGTTYQPTYDQYDPTKGGYVNPNDPTQILQRGPAWDPEK